MKTFREHLNEEVKIGALSSGGIDIERDAVRDEINGILAAIAARPCVTPYSSLNKVRKALAYFSIFLPKRVYLEGRHGVEVWEVKQFGDKMGVTDQGEWIHHVPAKYYVFFQYHRMGSMYFLEAKIVDEKELETKLGQAEDMVAEETDAATRLDVSKQAAPKEPLHDVTSDEKKKGNEEAVADSEKGLDEAKAPWEKEGQWSKMMKKQQRDAERRRNRSPFFKDGKYVGKTKVKLDPEKEISHTVHDVGPGGKKTLSQSGKMKVKDLDESNKANKLKKRDWQDPKKRSKQDEKWDPRDALSGAHRGRKVAEEAVDDSEGLNEGYRIKRASRNPLVAAGMRHKSTVTLSPSEPAPKKPREPHPTDKFFANYRPLKGKNETDHEYDARVARNTARQKAAVGLGEEQLDELKKSTLASYKKKASNDLSSAKTYNNWNIDQDYENPKTREKSIVWSRNQVAKREKVLLW